MKAMQGKMAKAALAALICLTLVFAAAACDSQTGGEQDADASGQYVVSIEKTSSGELADIYTVTYSDGSTSQLTVEHGRDGEDLSIVDIWQDYCAETGEEISLSDFVDRYLDLSSDTSASIAQTLLSSVSIYTEFVETSSLSGGFPGFGGGGVTSSQISQGGGSGVIYRIEGDDVYIVTNYHVVYNSDADASRNGGSQFARSIRCYLYGSEATPVISGYDENGYYVYDYGSSAIECEYVGGSLEADLAVLRADLADVQAVNPDVQAVTLADGYTVGERVYAIGNAEGEGLSVTEGIVSVDSEYISLDIDGDNAYESYRSIRFDAAIYHGNSGGGLYNAKGELIGITNAGTEVNENMCYAIPVSIVRGTVENILYHANDGDESTNGVLKITLGVTVSGENARYVLDQTTGLGKIVEDITVQSVTAGSLAESMGLGEGDVLTAAVINGTSFELDRTFDLGDLILTLRPGDTLSLTVTRAGESVTTSALTLEAGQFAQAE